MMDIIDIFAQIAGYVAMATVFCSFQVKSPRGTLWVMAVATGLFALHFGLLGAVTGAILNVLNVVRNIAILYTDPKKLSGKAIMHIVSWMFFAAPFVFALLPGVTVGIPDFILGAIMTVAAYLFWTQRTEPIRIGHFFLVSPGWIWYNVLSHSLPGVITECLNMLSVVIFYLRRIWSKTKKTAE